MGNPPSRPLSQKAIREVVEVVRQWYLTICHDLCLDPPNIRIRKPVYDQMYNMPPIGLYESQSRTVTIFVCGENLRDQYLLTLAHELKHAWQHQNNIPPTERDAEEYEAYFSQRFRKGPEAGEYLGPIEGLNVIFKCRRCGQRIDARTGMLCPECSRRAEPLTPSPGESPPSHTTPRTESQSWAVRLKDAYSQRLRDRNARHAAEQLAYRITQIDNHPENGHPGWWRIEEAYYVFASTAGEAIIRVANQPLSDCPIIEYLGNQLPPHVRRSMKKS